MINKCHRFHSIIGFLANEHDITMISKDECPNNYYVFELTDMVAGNRASLDRNSLCSRRRAISFTLSTLTMSVQPHRWTGQQAACPASCTIAFFIPPVRPTPRCIKYLFQANYPRRCKSFFLLFFKQRIASFCLETPSESGLVGHT